MSPSVLKTLLLLPAAACLPLSLSAEPAPSLRSWRSEDTVAIRNFVQEGKATSRESQAVFYSPDREHFFFTTYRGELEHDTTAYTLTVYSMAAVRQAPATGQVPAPLAQVVHRTASPEYQGIEDVQWDQDSRDLVYSGTDGNGILQVFRISTATGACTQLTFAREHAHVDSYRNGGLVYFVSHLGVEELEYPYEETRRDENGQLQPPWWRSMSRLYYGSFNGAGARPLFEGSVGNKVRISPNGRRAAFLRNDRFFAVELDHDTYPVELSAVASQHIPSQDERLHAKGVKWRWSPTNLFWIDEGQRLLLVNTTVAGKPEAPRSDGKSSGYIATYDLGQKEWGIVSPMAGDIADPTAPNITQARWSPESRQLTIVRSGESNSSTEYLVLNEKEWEKRTTPVPAAPKTGSDGTTVFLRQNANTPPRLIASRGEKEVDLAGPDRALDGIWLSPMQDLAWEENGKKLSGGLWLPRDHEKRGRLPLVIQTHDFMPHMFLPDGPSISLDRTQLLVAHGFAVVQIDSLDVPRDLGIRRESSLIEGPAFVRRIDAIVDLLDQREIIDRNRVGVTGFSRGGYQTLYAITHPGRVRLAAAIDVDGWAGSFPTYLAGAGFRSGGVAEFDHPDSGKYAGTFWKKPEVWLQHDPFFNVHRVRTPFLYVDLEKSAHNGQTVYTDFCLQIMGAFHLNRKPLEFLTFSRRAQHVLTKPRQLVAMGNVVADWMGFWLKGEIPHDPKFAARWTVLRNQQAAVLKSPPPPEGQWTFVPETGAGKGGTATTGAQK